MEWYLIEPKDSFPSSPHRPNSILGRLVEVSRSHTPGKSPLNEWSACRRDRYLHNTQQAEETNIRTRNEIGTRDPNNRMDADLRRRQHGYQEKGQVFLSLTPELYSQQCDVWNCEVCLRCVIYLTAVSVASST
jgi:hypothetical protein